MRVAAIIQARMNSSRLPGKVLMEIEGKPMIQQVLDRLSSCKNLDITGIATSIEPSDDILSSYCGQHGINCFRGSLNDPLDRYLKCALHVKAGIIVRITGDCPLIDPSMVDQAVARFKQLNCDYLTNDSREQLACSGFDVEIFTLDTLRRVNKYCEDKEREHVVAAHIFNNYQRFDANHLMNASWTYTQKLSVDTEQDLEKVRRIYKALGSNFTTEDVRKYLGIPKEACWR